LTPWGYGRYCVPVVSPSPSVLRRAPAPDVCATEPNEAFLDYLRPRALRGVGIGGRVLPPRMPCPRR